MLATRKITPEVELWSEVSTVAGTTTASATRAPEHGSIAELGPRIITDLWTMSFSA